MARGVHEGGRPLFGVGFAACSSNAAIAACRSAGPPGTPSSEDPAELLPLLCRELGASHSSDDGAFAGLGTTTAGVPVPLLLPLPLPLPLPLHVAAAVPTAFAAAAPAPLHVGSGSGSGSDSGSGTGA